MRKDKIFSFLYKKGILLHNKFGIIIRLNGGIMLSIWLFLIGFGMAIIGFMYIILYLNYLSIGYSFIDYIKIIFTNGECLLSIIGLIIIYFVIGKER